MRSRRSRSALNARNRSARRAEETERRRAERESRSRRDEAAGGKNRAEKEEQERKSARGGRTATRGHQDRNSSVQGRVDSPTAGALWLRRDHGHEPTARRQSAPADATPELLSLTPEPVSVVPPPAPAERVQPLYRRQSSRSMAVMRRRCRVRPMPSHLGHPCRRCPGRKASGACQHKRRRIVRQTIVTEVPTT